MVPIWKALAQMANKVLELERSHLGASNWHPKIFMILSETTMSLGLQIGTEMKTFRDKDVARFCTL